MSPTTQRAAQAPQQAAQPAPVQELPRRAQAAQAPQQPPQNLQEVLGEMQAWYKEFLRATAGYMSLDRASRTKKGQLAPDERPAGLPILEWATTVDGRDAARIGIDLKKVDPQYLDHVLVPLMTALAGDLNEAVAELELRLTAAKAILAGVITPQT